MRTRSIPSFESVPSPSTRERGGSLCIGLVLALAALCPAQTPGTGGLRGPATAAQGSTILVDAACNEGDIVVYDPTTGASTQVPVAPGKRTEVPIPNAPGGTIVILRVGRGLRCSVLLVEVVEA